MNASIIGGYQKEQAMRDKQISKHFRLSEMTSSQYATRHGIINEPNKESIANLGLLCENVLEPIREYIDKPLIVSSGYRSTELNRRIGGSKTSQHCKGQAADFTYTMTGLTNAQLWHLILAHIEVSFDQIIYEFGQWIHISYAEGMNRGRMTMAERSLVTGRVSYTDLTYEEALKI
jgi:hypothetical protein